MTTTALPEEEFMRRLRARFIERAGSDEVADAVPFAEWAEGFEDDPEGAADEELSYWTDDGDAFNEAHACGREP